jgi:hypothetical protein
MQNNGCGRGGNGNNNGQTRKEQQRTENCQPTSRERSISNSKSSEDEDEIYAIHNCREEETEKEKTVPSTEILVAIPVRKGSKKYKTYLGLVDSGYSGSLVSKELMGSTNFNIKLSKKATKWDKATGILQTDGTVEIEKYILPQFTHKRYITTSFHMFQKRSKDKYYFILGRNLLQESGLDIHYSASQFVWDNIIVNMVPWGFWTNQKIENAVKTWNTKHHESKNSKTKTKEELQLVEIKPAEYRPTNIEEVVQQQTHLTPNECNQLHSVLLDFQDLFKGQGGNYNGEPVELELLPGSKPFYAKPFLIPKAYQQVMHDKIARLESIGLLTNVPAAEWAAPTFIIPKKNQTVRVITDFRGLNKCLKRNLFPMPKIPDIFRGMEKFQYTTMIDLNMGY